MSKNKIDAQAPSYVNAIAKALPKRFKRLACHGVHTLSYDCDRCVVCSKDVDFQRKPIALTALRHPPSRNSDQQISIVVDLPLGVQLMRQWYMFGGNRWSLHWQRNADQYRAFVKPSINFGCENVSAKIRADQRERQCNQGEDNV